MTIHLQECGQKELPEEPFDPDTDPPIKSDDLDIPDEQE